MSRFLDGRLSNLTAYTPGEQPQKLGGIIKLNTNENPYPPSPGVIDALQTESAENLRLYSDPDCKALVEAIAERHGVRPENVFPGNGSDEVLAFCFHGLSPKGAAFPDISYGFYKVFAAMFGVPYREVPLRGDFTVNVEDYAGESGTVYIANPNAPTGICLPLGDIETLLCQNRERLVVVDEAYVEFGGETALPLLARYDNLLIVRTFSKSHSLAGARLGYAIGSAELVSDLNTLKFSFNPYNVNRLSIAAGAAAMRDDVYYADCCGKIAETREYTANKLRALGFTVTESKANFIFAGGNDKISGAEYFDYLRKRYIFVRHFDIPRINNYVRITVGTPNEMETLINVTVQILESIG